ncbi:MAG: hypothetical protein GY718_11725 [Lentisphaerae bacterium]|nr:hypothetical protein [Lentisphaerota bacterium]
MHENLINIVLPAMDDASLRMGKINLRKFADNELLVEINGRRKEFTKYQKAYENYCIPFGHGVRFFLVNFIIIRFRPKTLMSLLIYCGLII